MVRNNHQEGKNCATGHGLCIQIVQETKNCPKTSQSGGQAERQGAEKDVKTQSASSAGIHDRHYVSEIHKIIQLYFS